MVGGSLWINQQGFEGKSGEFIKEFAQKKGISIDFEKIHFHLTKGVSIKKLRVRSPGHKEASASEVTLKVDRSKAIRGIFLPRELKFSKAQWEPSFQNTELKPLLFEEMRGRIGINRKNTIRIHKLEGMLNGINLSVHGEIKAFQSLFDKKGAEPLAFEEIYSKILAATQRWQFPKNTPPHVDLHLSGQADNLKIAFTLSAQNLSIDQYLINETQIEGTYFQKRLKISQATFDDGTGALALQLKYDFSQSLGAWSATSSLHLSKFLRTVLGIHTLESLSSQHPPLIKLQGKLNHSTQQNQNVVTGHVHHQDFSFLGQKFTSLDSPFSWKNGNLFLPEISLQHEKGLLSGKILMKDQQIRYDFRTSFTPQILAPFIPSEGSLHDLVTNLKVTKESSFHLEISGEADPENLKNWAQYETSGALKLENINVKGIDLSNLAFEFHVLENLFKFRNISIEHESGEIKGSLNVDQKQIVYDFISSASPKLALSFFKPDEALYMIASWVGYTPETSLKLRIKGFTKRSSRQYLAEGSVMAKKTSYRGIPLNQVSGDFRIDQNGGSYENVDVELDLRQHPMTKAYKTPSSAFVKGLKISNDNHLETLTLQGVQGSAPPQDILSMFLPQLAQTLNVFQFQRFPDFLVEGVIDLDPERQQKTDLNVILQSRGGMIVPFLGKDVVFRQFSSHLHISPKHVHLSPLTASVFGGNLKGDLKLTLRPKGQKPTYQGQFGWNNLQLSQLGTTYKIPKKQTGTLDGSLTLSGDGEDLSKLNGQGNILLKKGNLFSVPIFGPLSPILQTVTQDKRNGYERAKNASCSYLIRKGILYTDDFIAETSSIRTTGSGNINFKTQKVNLTIRTNTRGLIGFITLPLKPFLGLFQFHADGTINDPRWKNKPFTAPPEKERIILLKKIPKTS